MYVGSAAWCAAGGWLRLAEVCGAECWVIRHVTLGDSGGTGARQPTHTLLGWKYLQFCKISIVNLKSKMA